jgi:hypothetical protein
MEAEALYMQYLIDFSYYTQKQPIIQSSRAHQLRVADSPFPLSSIPLPTSPSPITVRNRNRTGFKRYTAAKKSIKQRRGVKKKGGIMNSNP